MAQLLATPDVQRAVPQFFGDVAPKFNENCAGSILSKVETFAYEKSDTRTTSEDPDEVEVAGQLWLSIDPDAEWKVTADNLIATFTANFSVDGRILWPGDKHYQG